MKILTAVAIFITFLPLKSFGEGKLGPGVKPTHTIDHIFGPVGPPVGPKTTTLPYPTWPLEHFAEIVKKRNLCDAEVLLDLMAPMGLKTGTVLAGPFLGAGVAKVVKAVAMKEFIDSTPKHIEAYKKIQEAMNSAVESVSKATGVSSGTLKKIAGVVFFGGVPVVITQEIVDELVRNGIINPAEAKRILTEKVGERLTDAMKAVAEKFAAKAEDIERIIPLFYSVGPIPPLVIKELARQLGEVKVSDVEFFRKELEKRIDRVAEATGCSKAFLRAMLIPFYLHVPGKIVSLTPGDIEQMRRVGAIVADAVANEARERAADTISGATGIPKAASKALVSQAEAEAKRQVRKAVKVVKDNSDIITLSSGGIGGYLLKKAFFD